MRRPLTGLCALLSAGVLFFAMATPARSADGDAKTGKTIYEKRCLSCHGKNGRGIGSMPDFSNGRDMTQQTDEQLFQKISAGGRGSGMPGYEKILSEHDRWSVLAYIRTLSK